MAMTLAQVRAAMLAKAKGSGLSPSDCTKLKLAPLTADALKDVDGLPQYLAAFRIPYFDIAGNVTKFARYRYVEEPRGFTALTNKPIRYAQQRGSVNEMYLAPFADWPGIAADVAAPIIFTEGELKAACATAHDLPTIGLGGVTMFSDRKHGNFVLPMLKRFKWESRRAFVVFDSDAATNPNVLRAEAMLCREMLQLGAVPFVVRLPRIGEEKTGMDDFIVSEGAEAMIGLLKEESQQYGAAKALYELNEEVLYVNAPDIVYAQSTDVRMRTDKFVSSHFAHRRYLVAAEKGMVEKSAPAEWLKWERRAEVHNFTYAPGGPQVTDDRHFNLWKPWPHFPVKGDIALWHKLMEWLFLDTPADNRRWFEQWIAYPMQHPGAKLKQAGLIWGGQGTGKSFSMEIIARLYGDHNSTKFDNHKLNSAFNDWAEHKQFAIGEEIVVHQGEKKAISEMLKTLITDTAISINRKYVNSYRLPNCMNIVLLSNHAAALKLEEDDRRFFVHQVKAAKMPKELYQPLDSWSRSAEGLAALFYYFLHLDLSGFDPQAAAFQTADRRNMIASGRSEHGTWVADLRDHPDNVLKIGEQGVPFCLYTSDDLLLYFKAKHEKSSITAVTIGNELSMQHFRRASQHVVRTASGSKRLWVIRDQPEFKRFTPGQFGEFYDSERAAVKKTAKKGTKF